MSDLILNRVAESGIVTIDLETFFPKEEIVVFDIKTYLFKGLILKEKEFRDALRQTDWEQYRSKYVAIMNTADAIIPMWAYMLITSYLQPLAKDTIYGTVSLLRQTLLLRNIDAINVSEFAGKRIVIKGCGDVVLPEAAYVLITHKLRSVVKSLMYGEPCSMVPVYKAPQEKQQYS